MLGNHINPVFRAVRKQHIVSSGVAPGDGCRVASAEASAQSAAVLGDKNRRSPASTAVFCFPKPQSPASRRFFGFPQVLSPAASEFLGFLKVRSSAPSGLFCFPKMRSTTSSEVLGFPKMRSTAARALFCSPGTRSPATRWFRGVRKRGSGTAGPHFFTYLLDPSTTSPAAPASLPLSAMEIKLGGGRRLGTKSFSAARP